MACDISSGVAISCKDSIGGIKTVYMTTDDLGEITYDVDDSTITAFAGLPEFFQFDLRGTTNSLVQTITSSEDTGTSLFDMVASMTFPRLSKEMNKELKLMVYSTPTLVVEDYNGNQMCVGTLNGCSANSGTVVTGAAKTDLTGYTLTMQAMEREPANFLEGGIVTCGGTISSIQIGGAAV